MELLASWNNLSTQINNKNNLFVQNNFLKNTEILKLKNSIIIQGREIDTNNFLFLLENNNTFLILQINISSEYPIEKSRIHKYTELDLLLELEILQNKLKKIYYKIMEKVIQKIFYLNIFSSKPYLYKLNSQFCHTFYIKPNEVSIPLMNKLLFNENESNINIVEKTFNLV